MSVMLMKTSTPRAGDEENRFPAHYSEADQMARFSSTGGCRYNNGKDMIALLAMYIMILHILHPDRHRIRLHHPGANSKVSPSSESWFPQSLRRYFPSCRGVAKLVFRRCGWMSDKASSFWIIHEDYKESGGQGHKGSSDQRFWREEIDGESIP